MNAVEKALRHIEQLQKRLISKLPAPKRKSAKQQAKAAKGPDQQKPRVVSKRRRHTSAKREAYNPPVTHPDVSALQQTFAPPPDLFEPLKVARPAWADAWERAHPSRDMAEAPKVAPRPAQARTLGSCKAIDADTGRQCRLLTHDAETPHRSERGAFTHVLVPGGVPRLRQTLDSWAWDGREESDRQSDAQQKAASRRRLKQGIRHRRDGHGALKAAIARIQMEASP